MIKKQAYGLLAAFSAAVYEGLFLGYTYLVLFSIAMLMALWADIVGFHLNQGKRMRGVTITRSLRESYGRKNQWVPVKLVMQNNGRKSTAFNYFDTLSDVFGARGDYRGYVVIRPGETITFNYEISPQAVGKYYVGPVNMYSEDPLRLSVLNYVAERATEIRVAPSPSDIYSARTDRMSNVRFTEGLHKSKSVGQGYNFYGIRPYIDSDDLRHVSWSRYGLVNGEDIYVKQMEEERQLDVYFAIDYSLGTNFGYSARRMYDRFIINSINAGYSILRNHDGVGFLLLSSEFNEMIKASRSQVSINALERLVSEIRPAGDFDLHQALGIVRDTVKKSSLVIILTPLSSEGTFKIPRVSMIQKGKQITVFIVEPSEFIKIETLEDPYNRIMAETLKRREIELKSYASMIRSLGTPSYVVRESHLFARMMMEYQYGKIVR